MGRKAKVACLGLAFKPDIDDLRESPAVSIAKEVLIKGYDLVVVEPNIQQHNKFELVELNEALNSADVLAILVKHKQFKEANKNGKFNRPGIIDFCGIGYE